MSRAPREDDAVPASVLVAYATRFGSTQGVAERIAGRLRERGLRAEARAVDDVAGAGAHDAVVLGSPVFDQRWTPEAEAFVHREHEALARRPVWLFSVATFGDRKRLVGRLMRREPKGIDEIAAAVHPRGYRVFAGVIERRRWPPAGRLLYHAFGGRFGDRRDWPDIEAWADGIATALPASAGATMTATTGPDPAPGGAAAYETATVGEVMSPGVLSCAPHVPAPIVARMMATHGIHAVVVTAIPDAGARDEPLLCGIISDLDLLRAAQPRIEPLTAHELAATEALTVAPECPLPEAVRLMDDHGVRHLVVAARRRPVGTLSALDVAGVLAWGVG